MKKIRGFTLTELLVVVGIASVLMAIGGPSLTSFIQNGRITTVTNELISALHVARNEAIRSNGVACVCSSDNANSAVPACNAGGNWEEGWFAFFDVVGNCQYNDGVDRLIKIWDGASYATNMTVATTSTSISPVDFVRFDSRGAPKVNAATLQQGLFNICDDRGVDFARGVQMTVAGSVKSTNVIALLTCP